MKRSSPVTDEAAILLTPGRQVIVMSPGRSFDLHAVTVEKVDRFKNGDILVLVKPPAGIPTSSGPFVFEPRELEVLQ